jgi:hypothetical protein
MSKLIQISNSGIRSPCSSVSLQTAIQGYFVVTFD